MDQPEPFSHRGLAWVGALLILLFGIATLVAGLLYGALLVGAPTQDPTPEQAARESLHVAVSTAAMIAGLLIAAAGAVLLVIRRRESE